MKNTIYIILSLLLIIYTLFNVLNRNTFVETSEIDIESKFNTNSLSYKEEFIDSLKLIDKFGNKFEIGDGSREILFVYSDNINEGCRECLGLELNDWEKFSNQYNKKFIFSLIISKPRSKLKLEQELKVIGYKGAIYYDENGKLYNSLKLKWSPAILIFEKKNLYKLYIGDMNDRNKTQEILDKYQTEILSAKI
ncbi:MAG: hypothetical protein SFU91_03525 [Chloroherpetonaceae bacterium]|nr:hypothetical protein [Chloroherpetonaceae bacterium]